MQASRGLDFNRNPTSMHLLASSGPDGELHIWDCAAPSRPKLYPILKVRHDCMHSGSEVEFDPLPLFCLAH